MAKKAEKAKKAKKGHKLTAAQKKKMRAGAKRYWAKVRADKAGERADKAAPNKRKKGSLKKAKKSGTYKLTAAQLKAIRQRAARKAARKRRQRPARAHTIRKGKGLVVNVKLVQPRSSRKAARRGEGRRKSNPIMGGSEWLTAITGFVSGGVFVGLFDRIASTHPLVAGQTGATGSGAWNDSPAPGQLYNAEAIQAPIWSSVTRMLVAAVSVVTPFGIAAAVKNPNGKTFFQLFGFGALAVTAIKGINDVVALASAQSSFGARLYAPEIMAQNDAAALNANGSPLPTLTAPVHTTIPSNPPSLAGVPRAVPQLAPQSRPAPTQSIATNALRQAPPPPVQNTPSPSPAQGMAGVPTDDGISVMGNYFREDFQR